VPASEFVAGRYLRWLLAVLSAACGLVHFAASGEHFDLSWMHGGFFAVVGWLQLAWAVAVVVRPEERRLLVAGAVLHGGTFAVWLVSRTLGVPVGPDAGVAESIGFADAMTSIFEAVIVAVVVAVLWRPSLGERAVRPAVARTGLLVGALSIAGISTTAITPSFASDHHDRMDGHGGGHGEVVIAADGSSECEHSGVTNAGNSANGGHGHRGPVPWQPLDAEGRATLSEQLAAAQSVVERYPTVADAEAAGFTRASVYVPCIAAHYLSPDRTSFDPFDPAKPQMLLFASTDPDGELVGLSYSTVSLNGPPEGFEGPNDVWHAHAQLCMKPGVVLGVETADKEDCEARGGVLADTSNDWMMHMWPVAEWQNRWGLFASEHPDLGGRMGDKDAPPDPEADGTWFEESEETG
jgi:hypothetical protein